MDYIKFFSETDHRILSIFCTKLACSGSKKVTEADFRKDFFCPKLDKMGPNFLEFASLDFAHFPYLDRIDQYLQLGIDHHG